MKKTIVQIATSLLFAFSYLHAEEAKEDEIIQLDGKIAVSQESDRWLKVTVPFLIKQHPEILKLEGKRPETIEELFNPEFLENLRIKIWISFLNEFKRSAIRGDRNDPRLFDYYSAELECMVLEIDRKTKKAEFLFPAAVAKKNELGNYPKLTGYVIEFSCNGEVFTVSDQITFLNYEKKEYLEKYRMEALNNSTDNEGVLIPAYQISEVYLRELGPVVRD
tara:strand:- start:11845 stop:12507 length:663 start_codon:yes stop_codon:yes gene_type:complete